MLDEITFSISANPGLIGTIISSTATANANQPEMDLTNNVTVLQQPITGGYDPNEKAVWPALDPLNYYFLDYDTLFRNTLRSSKQPN